MAKTVDYESALCTFWSQEEGEFEFPSPHDPLGRGRLVLGTYDEPGQYEVTTDYFDGDCDTVSAATFLRALTRVHPGFFDKPGLVAVLRRHLKTLADLEKLCLNDFLSLCNALDTPTTVEFRRGAGTPPPLRVIEKAISARYDRDVLEITPQT